MTGPGKRTSIATVCLSGSLEDKLTAVAAAGFDGVEIFEPDLISSPLGAADIASRAADLGLSIDLYQPFRDLDSTDDAQFRRNLVRAERKFDVMSSLGCDLLLVCSSPSAGAVHDDGLLTEQLSVLADRAQERGIRLAYEALAWGAHVNTYRHAWSIVAEADHPALGTCLDSFHILSRGDDPSGIGDIPGEKIFFLQLADAPHLVMDVLQWSRHYRCFPGQGTFDLAGFGAHVTRSGYQGPWSLEIFNDVFRESETGRTASDAHRSLLHLQDLVAAVPAAVSPETLFTAPQRGPIENIVSVRLAAGPASAGAVSEALGHLGFDLTAAHSSHGLQLFSHGALAVAVDTTVDTLWTAPGVPANLPAIAQIGVRSDEPGQWLDRARAFGVPAGTVGMPGAATESESSVVRMRVTDAVSVDLRSRESASTWQQAFDLVRRIPVGEPRSPFLGGVDHVALAVPADEWDGIMLLLRSVLGLTPHEGQDVIDAVGLVRSRALTLETDTGVLRISLNMVSGSASEPPRAPRRGGVSHVAFATDDAVAAADAMAARGFVPLAVPSNYYDDLRARFDFADGDLEAMAARGILFDADGSGGEFRHFFTPAVGSDLFFEVVERRGGYQGYGETNNAVRVAAQLRAG